MDRETRALTVAVAAAVLLVVVVAVDVTVTRSFTLEAQGEQDAWITIASFPGEERYAPFHPGDAGVLEVNRTDTIQLRLTIDNEPFWSYKEGYTVFVNGQLAGNGQVSVPARGVEVVTLDVPGDRFLPEKNPDGSGFPREDRSGASVDVSIGADYFSAWLTIQEVSR